MNEEWRTIPDIDTDYEASNLGRVRSLKRAEPHIMAQQINTSGYPRVGLVINGKFEYLLVHCLVARAFIGDRPKGYSINHKNGIKTDNRAENLEYLTRVENMRHAREHGLHDNRGEKAYNARLTDELVTFIRFARSACGVSAMDIAAGCGVNVTTVRDVMRYRTWRHLP